MKLPVPRRWSAGDTPDAVKYNDLGYTLDFLMDPPEVVLRQTTVQSITTSTWTALTFQAEDKDNDAMWTSGATVTIATPGWYDIEYAAGWDTSAAGRRIMALSISTSTVVNRRGRFGQPAPLTSNKVMRNWIPWYFNAGDTCELHVWQDSGANRNTLVTSPEVQSQLAMTWFSK